MKYIILFFLIILITCQTGVGVWTDNSDENCIKAANV